MADPVITAIIPTFRRPRLLKRAIESVLAQSYRHVKVCVHDNASGDETEEVVAQYARRDDRVVYLKNSENIGAANNFVKGVEAVTTDFYSLLSDDDFLLPGFYEQAIAAFEKHPQAGFVCVKTITVDVMNKRMCFRNRDWRPGLHQPSNDVTTLMYNSHFTQTGVLLRTHMRESIGPFEKSGDDRLYLVMASAASPFVVLDMYGAVFSIHSQAYSVTTGLRQGDVPAAYEALLSTVSTVIQLPIPTDRKVHLLLLILRSYIQTFDAQQLEQLRKGVRREDESTTISLRSYATTAGLLAHFYEITPRRLRPLLTCCLAVFRHLRKRRRSRAKGNWSALPEDTCRFLLQEDSDVSRFLASIQETGG